MADMLRVAVSGLKAFQTALDTTSHNIANSTTPGYSRQRVNIVTQEPQTIGNASIGNGAQVGSVTRNVDDILTDQSRSSASSMTRLETYAGKAGSLNNLFADSTTGLSATLQKFTNALQGVASTPNSVAARQVLLSETNGVSERLKSYDRRLDELDAGIDSQLRAEAAAITTSAQNIARLNDQIVAASKSTGSPPNDLLDARDRELDELAKHINVNAVVQDNGAVNVSIGNGQALVTGNVAGTIVAQQDVYDPTRMTLAYQTAGSSVDLRNVLSGGSVGGLLDFRREMLDPARNELGQMTLALTSSVNAQHREGMDLGGALGGDLFSVGGVRVLPSQLNGGTANVSVARTGAAAIGSSDYVLQYSNNAWSLRRNDSGAPVAMTGTGTALDPFVADGLSISIGGGAANGDTFMVRPTAGAIDGLSVLINDPAKVAAAAPIRTGAGTANTGSATISAGEVLSVATPATLTSTATIQFTDATHYTINGAGNFTYSPGGNIDANGWRVQISGAPKAGDSFTVGANTGGTGDNRNALELASVLGKGVLAGGTVSLNQATSSLVGRIGVATGQAQASLDAQQIIHDDAMAQRDAVSGVNLDEEAANMLRYQQAYQAAAQVIRATQEMFDALLAATRR